MFEIELFWHLTLCKQKTTLILNWIVWNRIANVFKIDLALITYNGWCTIKPNQTKPASNIFSQDDSMLKENIRGNTMKSKGELSILLKDVVRLTIEIWLITVIEEIYSKQEPFQNFCVKIDTDL